MEVFGDEQRLCPCSKECQEFQTLVELKDSGLVVYCHRPRTVDIRQAEAVESAANTTRDVFILYNKKNVKITSSELTSELEKEKISCPRCRKTFEHAQKLLQEVKSIDKKMVMGICDHCREKAQGSKNPFCSCDKIVKKFISDKGEQKEDTKKYFKTLPLKLGRKRKDTMANKQKQNAYLDFQTNRGLTSPASRHEPEVKQMFSHTHYKTDYMELSNTNKKKDYVKQAFIQPIEPLKTSFVPDTPHESMNINTIIPGTSLVDSETTLVEISEGLKELPRSSLKDRKQEEIIEDRPSIDAKEALKRRHDLSIRQMLRVEKDSIVSVSKKPDLYETPKIVPWAQKEPTSKYHVESQMDIKIPTLKHNRGIRDLDYVPNREIKFRSTRASQDSYYDPRKANKYQHDKIRQGFYDSDEGPKKVKKLKDRYNEDEALKSQRSVDKISHIAKKSEQQHVAKSKSGPIETVGNVPEHKYSFFFPKLMEKEEKNVKGDVSSSHLIKDTQEKIRLQAEREKKRQVDERQKKLEQAQKKKLAREEKILQAEEKERQAAEDKKKIEEVQKKIEVEQRKLDEEEKIYEEEQKQLAEQLVVKEKKLDKPRRDTKKGVTEKNKMDVKVKPEKRGDVEVTEKGSKDLKSETLKKESSIVLIEDKEIQQLRTQKLQEKGEKLQKKKVLEYEAKVAKVKKKPELKAKRDELEETPLNEEAEKVKTNLKAKLKQEDKGVAKDQKIKPEREDLDKIIQREKTDKENLKKQMERLRDEKESRKTQAAKDKKEIDAPSKKRKADELKLSMSKIKKSLKKETSGKQETLTAKQGKEKESESKTLKKESSINMIDASLLQKLQAEKLLEKKKALQKKELLEYEAEVAKAKKEAELKAKRDAERSRLQLQKKLSDENLKFVILKQAKNMGPFDIIPDVLMIHKCNHQHSAKQSSFCQLCANSELELEVLSLDNKKNRKPDNTNIIIGEKLFKNKQRHENIKEPEGVPILFQKEFCVESDQQLKQILQIIPQETIPEQKQILLSKIETEPGKGVLRYALSDRTFIDKGWTILPTEKVVRKMNVYRMRPAHPEFDWFEHNKNKQLMTYDTGERLAEFDDNGRGRWYYRNGRLALDYYDAEETNAQQRYVIYSSGEPDERGRTHPITILATFDYLGNGIVFDHSGKIRLILISC